MYLIIGIIPGLCVLFYIICFYRRKSAVKKVCQMDCCEKLELFGRLTEPFGFSYFPDQDIMTSSPDAWQRKFGYCFLYDRTAPRFDMIFDCEPVYFNYRNRTWLIELWKGQYGLSLGGELGIYQADSILTPDQYDRAMFQSVPDEDLLPCAMSVSFKGQHLFSLHRTHWWLTGFRIGSYCEPEDLTMDVSLSFPDENMLHSFVESLFRLGYQACDLRICHRTVSFSFTTPHTWQPRSSLHFRLRISRWKNRIWCSLYQSITRPFICTADRILFLYFFLPTVFRHLFYFRKNRRQKLPRKCRRSRIRK